jgi:hypothetical protein
MSDTIRWEGGELSCSWHEPPAGAETFVVLAHGAGGNMHTPQLRSFANGLVANGLGALRFNFAYAEARKRAPDRTAVLEACYRAAAEAAATRARRIVLGGRSMGGRIGSHLAAQGVPCAGLVFLAYPLHPPGKPEKIRDAHLRDIKVPMLFLQGTRDPFADPELLAKTIASLPNATLHALEGGDHSHKVPGRRPEDVLAELVEATAAWISRL